MRRLSPSSVLLTTVLGSLWGCFDGGGKRCHEGEILECECDDGTTGQAYCGPDRRPGWCSCDSLDTPGWQEGPPSSRDASTSFGFDASFSLDASARDASLPADGTVLRTGKATLLDLFVRDDDVWVVDGVSIVRASLEDGAERARWQAPRPLTGALFGDGKIIAIDGAKLTLLVPEDLSLAGDVTLIEPCVSVALVSNDRLVCAGSGSTSRAFQVFDLATGMPLQQVGNALSSYDTRVKGIPGSSRFFTMGSSSSLYSVSPAGAVTQLSTTPLQTNVGPIGCFDADPPTNIVSASGALYRIDEACIASTPMSCLARNGTLGTFSGTTQFLAMDNNRDRLFGLTSNATSSFDTQCTTTSRCQLEVIDVAARLVQSRQTVGLPMRKVVALRATPSGKSVVLGFEVPSEDRYGTSVVRDYQVTRIDVAQEPGDAGAALDGGALDSGLDAGS